jgi:hypothetical protein
MIALTQNAIDVLTKAEVADCWKLEARLDELKKTLLYSHTIEEMRERWKHLKGLEVNLKGDDRTRMRVRLQANESVAKIMLGKGDELVDLKP